MGQKIHPIAFRLGTTKTWESRWFATGQAFCDLLHEDLAIRQMVKDRFKHAGIARVDIERASNRAKITIHTARPGIIIGRKGQEIEGFRALLEKRTNRKVSINIEEIKKADLSAQLVAENVASQLLRRIGFRRAMKQSMQRAMRPMKGGEAAKGIKVSVGGRLNGADIARTEQYHEGSIPLQTLRANIDYGFAEAKTTYGRLGVKVWIYKGQILPQAKKPAVRTEGGK